MGERLISLVARVPAFTVLAVLLAAWSAIVLTMPITASAQSPTPTLPKSQPKAQIPSDSQKAVPPVAWKKVPEPERKVLAPLEKDWDQLPGYQHRKLIGAAKAYPKLLPIQQERFQERIKEWAKLTPDQRHAARDKYKNLSRLPPQKQYELRERWNEKSEKEQQSATPSLAPVEAGTTVK